MSKTLSQIYVANPTTSIGDTDLIYVDKTGTADAAIIGSAFNALYANPAQVQKSIFNYALSGGSSDTYTVTLSPVPSSYTDGLFVTMTANHDNTGMSPTLNVNGLGTKNITIWGGGNLLPSDILMNSTYILIYSADNDTFELINPTLSTANTSLLQSSSYNISADSGTANAYVAALTPAPIVALSIGVLVYLEVANTNTSASTLALNGEAAAPIVMTNGNALTGGEMVAGSIAILMYGPGGHFILFNSALSDTNPQNGASRYVVDAGGRAEYTTIQAAINAAVANTPTSSNPGLVYVWAGTYTENLTIHDYVYLVAAGYGAVNVLGTMTYAGTGAFYMQKIFANQTGGPATFIASGTGQPTLSECNLTNTGGTCFQGSAINNPVLLNTVITANAGSKQFDLSGGCIVGWTNGLGNYTDTASTLNGAGLVMGNCSLGGAFILVGSRIDMTNSGGAVFNENLAFCAMDGSSVFTAQNCQIYSDAPTAAVVTGNGVFVADMVSLNGSQQAIDPLTQIQGHVNYLGYIARANNFVPGYFPVVTGSTGGTTAINPVLASVYEFTGTTNQIATLPNANLVYLAQGWTFLNQSTGVITVKNYGGTTLFTMQPYTQVTVTCYNNVGSNGTWLWTWANPGSGGYNPVANYVVSSVAGQAQYQTIQSAINAALATSPSSTTPALIWIFGGNYTENLTLYPWIDLASASDPSTAGVNVIGNAVYSGTGNISLSNVGFTTNNTNAALSFQSAGAADVHLQSVSIDAASGKGLECTSSTTAINGSIGSISAATGGKCFNITAGFVELLATSAAFTDTASSISGGEFRVFSCDLADAYDVTGGIAEFVGGTYVNSGSLPCFNIGSSGTVYAQDVICNSSSGTDNFVTGTGTFIYSNVSPVGGAQGIDTGLTLNGQPQYTGTQNVLGFVNANVGAGGFNWVPVVNTAGNFVCEVSPANSILQNQTISIPDGGTAASNFIISNAASGQFINSGYLQVDAGNIYIGNGGGAHSLICYPAAVNAGLLAITATSNGTGNFNTTITNSNAVAQSQTITIPDSGFAGTSSFVLTSSGNIQNITRGSLSVNGSNGNMQVGANNSGNTNKFVAYPAGNNTGTTNIYATNNSGNYANALTNAATTAARTWILPDADGTVAVETDGTFTPTLSFGGASTGITYSLQQGYYSRVGNTVTFTIYILLTSKGSDAGVAAVQGLPVTSRSMGGGQNGVSCEFNNVSGLTSAVIGFVIGGSTEILFDLQTSSSMTPLDNTNFTNTSEIFISGTYLV